MMWTLAATISLNTVFTLANSYTNLQSIVFNIDHGVGRRFDGIGAISGGGVSKMTQKRLRFCCKSVHHTRVFYQKKSRTVGTSEISQIC